MRSLVSLFAVLLMSVGVGRVYASDGFEYPIIEIVTLLEQLTQYISSFALGMFGTAPITVVLVRVLKQYTAVRSDTLVVLVSIFLTLFSILSNFFGLTVQYNSILDLLTVLIPAVLTFVTTIIGAGSIYNISNESNIPFIGQSRDDIE